MYWQIEIRHQPLRHIENCPVKRNYLVQWVRSQHCSLFVQQLLFVLDCGSSWVGADDDVDDGDEEVQVWFQTTGWVFP